MAIRIITDSTSDISQVQGEKMGITIVPLKVVFEDGNIWTVSPSRRMNSIRN